MQTDVRFDAMIFDCDGVLVDSEPIVNRVLRDEVAALGWDMTFDECVSRFVGASLEGVRGQVQEHISTPIEEEWVQHFQQRRDQALRADLEAMPGAVELVTFAVNVFGGRIACASNSERSKVELQLEKTGLLELFDGRIFSAAETGPEKPSPAVYLAAAREMTPRSLSPLIIEDSGSGVSAGKAAGGYVVGLATTVDAETLEAAGADTVVTSLDHVAPIIAPTNGHLWSLSSASEDVANREQSP